MLPDLSRLFRQILASRPAGLLLCLTLLASGAQASVHPRPAPVPTPPHRAEARALDGLWKGQLQVPGGQLEVIFRFVKLTGGDYFSTLDVPLQKVSRMAVKTEIEGDTVRLAADEAGCRFVGLLSANGQQLTGTWQQPGFAAPLMLLFSDTPTAAAKSQRLTPPYREEEATFTNSKANVSLSGTLTVPSGPGPFPAVVLLSDNGQQDRDGTVGDFAPLGLLADYLTRRGVAVLRFDDRGAGKSGGPAAATAADLVGDAQAGLNYLRTRSEINLTRLGLIGHGEGGNVALLTATQPLPPAFVVALAAYGLPGRELLMQQQASTLRAIGTAPEQVEAALKRQQTMLDVISRTPDQAQPQAQAIVATMLRQNNATLDESTAQASAAEMTSSRYRYFLAHNPAERLGAVNCPVLLLNGTADLVINADGNLNALRKGLYANKTIDLTVKRLLGVNHLFQPDPTKWPVVNGQPRPNFSPEAEEIIREWIVGQVKK